MTSNLPPLMTTGIGSLPMTDADEAAAFVLDEADLSIPFWPQLPRRGFREHMVPQYAAGLPCVGIDPDAGRIWFDPAGKYEKLEPFYEAYLGEDPAAFALSEEAAAGLAAFRRHAEGRRWPLVKGQVTGPLTLAMGVPDANKSPLYADADLRDAAVKLLARCAQWQIGVLRPLASEAVLIFVDEPLLAAYASSAYVGISESDVRTLVGEVFEAIAQAGGLSGIHVCGNSDWGVVLSTGVMVLNFDAWQYGPSVALYPEQVSELFDRGGRIAWGIVPTTAAIADATIDGLARRMEECFSALAAKGLGRDRVLAHSMLTPSCGAGSLSPDEAAKVFRLLAELRGRLTG